MFNDPHVLIVFYFAVILFPFAIPAVHAIIDRAPPR
jgi:hypothetical protein